MKRPLFFLVIFILNKASFGQCFGGMYDCFNGTIFDACEVIPVKHPEDTAGGFYVDLDVYLS